MRYRLTGGKGGGSDKRTVRQKVVSRAERRQRDRIGILSSARRGQVTTKAPGSSARSASSQVRSARPEQRRLASRQRRIAPARCAAADPVMIRRRWLVSLMLEAGKVQGGRGE